METNKVVEQILAETIVTIKPVSLMGITLGKKQMYNLCVKALNETPSAEIELLTRRIYQMLQQHYTVRNALR